VNPEGIFLTDDGSSSILDKGSNESYHSRFGAVQESKVVFLDAGFRPAAAIKPEISILEAGFGTGLNAFLTIVEADKSGTRVSYDAIEPFPLTEQVFSKLNYPEFTGNPSRSGDFISLHQAPPSKPVEITPGFTFTLFKERIEEISLANDRYDLIYFDLFSPDSAPGLWTEVIFRKLFDAMKAGGILVTYCCKGEVKRSLKSAGFLIEKLPGPPGKREILRAQKIAF
jgi:tRNA U34 5-methylaminomethyl-2-thiouridine-forming methyltransferase MnmC